MAPVTHKVEMPDGTVPKRAQIAVRLIATSDPFETEEGHVTGQYSIGGVTRPTLDSTGTWSLNLTPNASILPAGTVYEVVEELPGMEDTVLIFSVPSGGGQVQDLLTDPPGTLPTAATATETARAIAAELALTNTKVDSVAAGDGTITIGGTTRAPTVAVNVITEAKVTGLIADLAAKIAATSLGQPLGPASLDGAGKLLTAQLPSLAITDVSIVASAAAMLAIPGAHQGSVAVRTDIQNQAFMHNAGSAGTLADWTEIGFGDVLSVNGATGAVTITAAGLGALVATSNLADLPSPPTARASLGLGNVDNTADVSKPVSTAQQAALNGRQARWNPRVVATVGGGSTFTLAAYDQLEVDATLGAATVNAPPTPSVGDEVTIKKTDASANGVTFIGTLDGTVNPSLIYRYGTLQCRWDGSTWIRPDRHSIGSLVDYPATPDARYVKVDGTNLGAVVSEGGAAAGNLGATSTFDFASRKRAFKAGTLNANCVVTAANLVAGSQGWLSVTQDISGGWTLGVSDGTTTQPVTITGTAGGTSLVRIYSVDGTALIVEVAGGPSGPRGAKWWSGAGAPTTVAGASTDDFYVNRTTGEVWQSTAGTSTWVDQGFSVQGPTGATGPTGPTGPAASDASATAKGIVKLTVAPVSSSNPIAVGDNDLRFNVPARMTRDLWRPTGRVETFDRLRALGNVGALQSGRLALVGGAVLAGGTSYNTIHCFSGTTAAGTPTNQWFCLVDVALNVLVKTADDTTTAWAANTGKALALASTYTPANDIAVYVGVVVVATTVPTLTGVTSGNAGPLVIDNIPPVLAALSTTGLTNPASLGATASALAVGGAFFYAQVY